MCQSLFLTKVAGLWRVEKSDSGKSDSDSGAGNSLSCEFCEISKKTFFADHLWATASLTPNSENIQKCRTGTEPTKNHFGPPDI